MIFLITKSINDELLDEFIRFVNSLNETQSFDIYISCPGGKVASMEAILNIIDQNKYRVRLYAYGEIASSAFELFFKSSSEKHLLPGCIGMYHRGYASINIDERGTPTYKSDESQLAFLKKYCNDTTEKLISEIGLNDKEIKSIRKGDDVWFQPDRMKEILKHIENGKN